MNPRVILHLIRTDWQRLRKPVIVLWVLWFVTALPWLLRDPQGFKLPFHQSDTGNADLASGHRELLWANPWSSNFLEFGGPVTIIMMLVLAAIMGMAGGTGLQPIRRFESLAARCLAIMAFLVMPGTLLVALHHVLQGFKIETVLWASLGHALTFGLFAGTVSLFASWCASAWSVFAGWVALINAVPLIAGILERQRPDSLRIFVTPWAVQPGMETWTFFLSSVLILGCLHAWFRPRFGMAARTAAAAIILLLAGYLVDYAGLSRCQPDGSRPLMPLPVAPSVGKAWLETEEWTMHPEPDGEIITTSVKAEFNPDDYPDGCAVEWEADGPLQIMQGGEVCAEVHQRKPPASIHRDAGRFMPKVDGDRLSSFRAFTAALPGRQAPPVTPGLSKSWERSEVDLGGVVLSPETLLVPGAPMRLTGRLRGKVYRYETVADLALDDFTSQVRHGDVVWQARGLVTNDGTLLADLVVKHPALGFSADPDHVRWDVAPTENCLFFLHLPETGISLATRQAFRADGFLFASAGWHRRILAVDEHEIGKMPGAVPALDFTGARLLVLRPAVVSELRGLRIDVPLVRTKPGERFSDFQMNHRYWISNRYYREELLPNRPDPRNCSRREFGRWLRAVLQVHPTSGHQVERDLACYAPRFADVMANVSRNRVVRGALFRGTPHSMRSSVTGAITDSEYPDDLFELALDRGWTEEVRPTVARFAEERRLEPRPIMFMEDPSTYDELIRILIETPTLELHGRLRQIPGIEAKLDPAINKAMGRADLPRLLVMAARHDNKTPFGPFAVGAKLGDPQALEAVIRILEAGGERGAAYYQTVLLSHLFDVPPFRGVINRAWLDFLKGKTSSDFNYDPLAMVWRPVVPKHNKP